jgi:hypothetical protein
VPFTLSHAAAAWPFRRTRLILSALIAGTFAPDIEYYIRLAPGGGWGHRLGGAFGLSLPLGLIFLWLFHRFVKTPAVALMPDAIERRLAPRLQTFRFGPASRFAMIVFSILVGIFTHILWDDFTHPRSFVFHNWSFLRVWIKVPIFGWAQYCEVFQYVSTVLGLAVLAAWIVSWYRRTPPVRELPGRFTTAQKLAIVSSMTMVAVMGSLLRALARIGVPHHRASLDPFVGIAIVTFGALFWWQLVVWGALLRWRAHRAPGASPEPYTQSRT